MYVLIIGGDQSDREAMSFLANRNIESIRIKAIKTEIIDESAFTLQIKNLIEVDGVILTSPFSVTCFKQALLKNTDILPKWREKLFFVVCCWYNQVGEKSASIIKEISENVFGAETGNADNLMECIKNIPRKLKLFYPHGNLANKDKFKNSNMNIISYLLYK